MRNDRYRFKYASNYNISIIIIALLHAADWVFVAINARSSEMKTFGLVIVGVSIAMALYSAGAARFTMLDYDIYENNDRMWNEIDFWNKIIILCYITATIGWIIV